MKKTLKLMITTSILVLNFTTICSSTKTSAMNSHDVPYKMRPYGVSPTKKLNNSFEKSLNKIPHMHMASDVFVNSDGNQIDFKNIIVGTNNMYNPPTYEKDYTNSQAVNALKIKINNNRKTVKTETTVSVNKRCKWFKIDIPSDIKLLKCPIYDCPYRVCYYYPNYTQKFLQPEILNVNFSNSDKTSRFCFKFNITNLLNINKNNEINSVYIPMEFFKKEKYKVIFSVQTTTGSGTASCYAENILIIEELDINKLTQS